MKYFQNKNDQIVSIICFLLKSLQNWNKLPWNRTGAKVNYKHKRTTFVMKQHAAMNRKFEVFMSFLFYIKTDIGQSNKNYLNFLNDAKWFQWYRLKFECITIVYGFEIYMYEFTCLEKIFAEFGHAPRRWPCLIRTTNKFDQKITSLYFGWALC